MNMLRINKTQSEQLRLLFPTATEQEIEEKISKIIADFLHMNEISEDIFAYDHMQLALEAMADADKIGNEIWQGYLESIEKLCSDASLTPKDLITAAYALALCREVKLRQEAQ